MPKRIVNPLLGWLACLAGFCLVALAAFKWHTGAHYDATVLRHLAAQPGTLGHEFATLFGHLADPLPVLIFSGAIIALAIHWNRRTEAIAAVAVIAGANLTTEILKASINHDRFQPFLGEDQPFTNAFPSGHTTAAASLAVALWLVTPPARRPAAFALGALFTLAVGVSVVVLKWHYPSDVLGGLCIALGWGCAATIGLRLAKPEEAEASSGQAASRFAISVK
jgi:membrane-associated phospholipid phosphatase